MRRVLDLGAGTGLFARVHAELAAGAVFVNAEGRRTDEIPRRRLRELARKVHERAMAVAIEHEQRLCSGLSEREREQLIDLLHKLQPELIELRGVHPGLG